MNKSINIFTLLVPAASIDLDTINTKLNINADVELKSVWSENLYGLYDIRFRLALFLCQWYLMNNTSIEFLNLQEFPTLLIGVADFQIHIF